MDKTLKELLGNILTKENLEIITEAYNKKLKDAKEQLRSEIEEEVRAEFTQQFEHDKKLIIEAADRLFTDTIREELEEFANDRKEVKEHKIKLEKMLSETKKSNSQKLDENLKVLNTFVLRQLKEEVSELSTDRKGIIVQRAKLAKAMIENKKFYQSKVKEHMEVMNKFVLSQLKEEVAELVQDKRLLSEQRIKAAKDLREARLSLQRQMTNKMKVLDLFVQKQLREEIIELDQDKKKLVETRVKMIREGKKQLEETRTKFIKEKTKRIEEVVKGVLKHEMTEMREDIKVARQNNFGRKIFETFASEYMTSYFSEATQVKKLMKVVEEKDKKLNEATAQLQNNTKVLKETKDHINKIEDGAKRTKILNDMLNPLSRDKRVMMAEMLEGTPTQSLQEVFKRYLPIVLADGAKPSTKPSAQPLRETRQPQKTVAVTGNKVNRLAETEIKEKNENKDQADIIRMKELAGLRV